MGWLNLRTNINVLRWILNSLNMSGLHMTHRTTVPFGTQNGSYHTKWFFIKLDLLKAPTRKFLKTVLLFLFFFYFFIRLICIAKHPLLWTVTQNNWIATFFCIIFHSCRLNCKMVRVYNTCNKLLQHFSFYQ